MENRKTYLAIDLKSFYASVECSERGLDPLTTNLVVADASRTDKTICLAVSPSLKSYGIGGRPRLFEVVQRVGEINALRRKNAPGGSFRASSYDNTEVISDPSLELGYITATPRMARYMKYSSDIFSIYMKYIAPEDMHVYSVDEVFIDVTDYLDMYKMSARDLAMTMIRDVLHETGITATAGIGTNMYLCKIAMDIEAKHMPADENGVRIAELDEMSYRRSLWEHTPISDFWRIGSGIEKRLRQHGLYTMGDIARCSLGGKDDYLNEDLLYSIFGVNAELIIDHAWGWESCTIKDIKDYRPSSSSTGSGQVLPRPYAFGETRTIVREMAEGLALDLVKKGLVTDQIVLSLGYDAKSLSEGDYSGDITTDYYGRNVPKHSHGSVNLPKYTSSTRIITQNVMELYGRIADPSLLVRRVNVTANRTVKESDAVHRTAEQMDFFTDYGELDRKRAEENEKESREKKVQQAILDMQERFGKNAVFKASNLEEGSTRLERNRQIGGHKA